jgi:putative iron-regulated protein
VLDSQTPLTADYLASLQTGQKGFHTIAFLLFGSNNDKQLDDFTPRDLEYLQAVSTVFDQTATALLTSWTEGVNGNPPYRDEFVKAGSSSNAYLTQNAAAEELVQGIMGLLDELANAKMGEPLEAQNPFLLEARFSHSSLDDFKANLRSVEITYLGVAETANGRGLSSFVASVDPALDRFVQQQIQAAQSAVAAIPGPIETTLCDPAAQPKIEAAMGSIMSLFNTFEQQVLPLVQE